MSARPSSTPIRSKRTQSIKGNRCRNSSTTSTVDALIAANPTNEVLPLQVAQTYANDKNFTEALKFVDQSIKVKETFRNLSAKANILYNAGRKDEAFAAADAAIAKGKADKVDTAAFEKRFTELKAGKM